jgi:hypothetical protein
VNVVEGPGLHFVRVKDLLDSLQVDEVLVDHRIRSRSLDFEASDISLGIVTEFGGVRCAHHEENAMRSRGAATMFCADRRS